MQTLPVTSSVPVFVPGPVLLLEEQPCLHNFKLYLGPVFCIGSLTID